MIRSYRIYGFQPYFMLIGLAVITCVGSATLILKGGPAWFEVAWFAVLGWFWFNALVRVSYRIDLAGDDVTFRSIVRRRQTRLSTVSSIRSRQAGLTTIRFSSGRVDVVGPIDGWHEFVTLVKTANPACELKGV
jgi:hypothetical protein